MGVCLHTFAGTAIARAMMLRVIARTFIVARWGDTHKVLSTRTRVFSSSQNDCEVVEEIERESRLERDKEVFIPTS